MQKSIAHDLFLSCYPTLLVPYMEIKRVDKSKERVDEKSLCLVIDSESSR